MSKTKIRNFETCEEWTRKIQQYLQDNKEKYIRLMLRTLHYETIEELQDAEYNQDKFGFDCGWVNLYPLNKEMAKEWKLDNDGVYDCIWDAANCIYSTQSTTIKEIIMRLVMEDMDLNKDFYIRVKLD